MHVNNQIAEKSPLACVLLVSDVHISEHFKSMVATKSNLLQKVEN